MVDKIFIVIILLLSLSNLNGNNPGSHKMQIELTPDRLLSVCSEPDFLKEPVMKKCSKCKKEKPLTEFYNHKECRKGKNSQCKKCVKEIRATYIKKKKNKILKDARAYYYKNREKYIEYTKKYNSIHKEKVGLFFKKSHKKYLHDVFYITI